MMKINKYKNNKKLSLKILPRTNYLSFICLKHISGITGEQIFPSHQANVEYKTDRIRNIAI